MSAPSVPSTPSPSSHAEENDFHTQVFLRLLERVTGLASKDIRRKVDAEIDAALFRTGFRNMALYAVRGQDSVPGNPEDWVLVIFNGGKKIDSSAPGEEVQMFYGRHLPRVEDLATAEARDELGRRVREAWVAWAREQPNPKPSWLVPYEGLSEADKEADRRIGESLFLSGYKAALNRVSEGLAEIKDLSTHLRD